MTPNSKITALCFVLILGTIYNLIELSGGWMRAPYADHWEMYEMFRNFKENGFQLAPLFEQHNEHRIVPSKVLFTLDYYLFSATQTFLYVANYLLSISVFYCLFSTLNRTPSLAIPKILNLCLSAFLGLNLFLALDLSWVFQSQFFFTLLFTVIALNCVRPAATSVKFFIGLIISIGFGIFSMTNGLIIPFIITIAAWYYRFSKVGMFLLLVASAIFFFLYFINYKSTSYEIVFDLGKIIGFAIYFLTNFSLNTDTGLLPRTLFMGLSLPFLVYSFFKIIARKEMPDFIVICTLITLFCGLSACMTGVGRHDLFDLQGALSDRYSPITLLYWICTIAVAIYTTVKLWQKAPLNNLIIPIALTCFGFCLTLYLQTRPSTPIENVRESFKYSLELKDRHDNDNITYKYVIELYYFKSVHPHILFMEENNLSIFAGRDEKK